MKRLIGSDARATRRLRVLLAILFTALALPTAVLIAHAYRQLKWEAFHQHRVLAEELSRRIDEQARSLIRAEERRGFGDFSYLTVEGDLQANYLQRSPLSRLPVESDLPGLIGYFQVDADGRYTTPLLPYDAAPPGLSESELAERRHLADRMYQVLSEHRLVSEPPPGRQGLEVALEEAQDRAEESESADAAGMPATGSRVARNESVPEPKARAQARFDELADQQRPALKKESALGRVEDLELDRFAADDDLAQRSAGPTSSPVPERRKRTEQAIVAESPAVFEPASPADQGTADLRVATFESEIDPFELARLDSGHFVLFRKVWRDNQRIIQGALINGDAFIDGLVERAFLGSTVARAADLVVAWQGEILLVIAGTPARRGRLNAGTYESEQLVGTLLHQTQLSPPLGALSLTFTLTRLPTPPGASIVHGLAVVIALVLIVGFIALYRLGIRQLQLARQQQDFVSAVSHELRTPLTSIRMYSEMLKAGWADDEKRREYYDYIHDESERLSRLITNVLQLARMSRGTASLETREHRIDELCDLIRSKAGSQVEQAGFGFSLDCPETISDQTIRIDPDAFSQILINLTDNALKFSADTEHRTVDFGCRVEGGEAIFSIRDYGPGIPRDQLRRIFTLFYRAENELTRETPGTGIGLALVRELADAMGGRIDVRNRNPGAQFELRLPVSD